MHERPSATTFTMPAFALVIVSFLLSTCVSLVSLHYMNQRHEHEVNQALATQIYEYIDGELSGPIMAARTMSANSFLCDTLAQEGQMEEKAFEQTISRYLQGIERGLGYQSSFVISDATKRYYTRDGFNRVVDPTGHKQDAWYMTFVNRDLPFDLDVDRDERDPNSLMVYVNAKIVDEQRDLAGICGVGVRMTGIQELFRSFEESFGVHINLVDVNGMVQVDTNAANIEAVNLSAMLPASKDGEYHYSELEGRRFAVIKYVENLDWFLVIQSEGASEAGQFASIIVLNAVLCLFVLVALFMALHLNRRQTNELTTASFVDGPTGLFNKRAYERDRDRLAQQGVPADLVCVAVDVNGLKTVNDTLGHDAGDELLRGAADCLSTCFAPYGAVYRVGGDEYTALLRMSEEELAPLAERVDQTVAAWSGSQVSELSVSCGYASAREFPDADMTALCRIADVRMYEEKGRYYERTGKPRR